jgi:hypothetical protein
LKKKLIEEIIEVFSLEHDPPSEDNIVNHPEYSEPFEVLTILKGRKWQDLEFREIIYLQQNLPNLTDISFRYYIPAFIIASLDYRSGDLETFVVYSFEPYSRIGEKSFEVFENRMSGFTKYQRIVIYKYLKLFYKHNPVYRDSFSELTLQYWSV